MQGAGNLNVFLEGNIFWQKNSSGLTGNLTFLSNNGSSARSLSMRGNVGSATNTLGHAVNGLLDNSNTMPDSSTLKLVGGVAQNSPKMSMEHKDGADRSDTIANLIVESPVGLTGSSRPLFKATDSNNKLTVTNTVTFQGTAATVELDDKTPASAGLITSNMTFTGTGSWTLEGDCIIEITGGTISNAADATISCPLSGDFTNGVHVGHVAVQVNYNDCLSFGGNAFGKRFGREAPTAFVDIGKYRLGTDVIDWCC